MPLITMFWLHRPTPDTVQISSLSLASPAHSLDSPGWREGRGQIKGLEAGPEKDRGTSPTTADIC